MSTAWTNVTLSTPERAAGISVQALLLKKSRYLMLWHVNKMDAKTSIYQERVCA
jgi:hypothetical protein